MENIDKIIGLHDEIDNCLIEIDKVLNTQMQNNIESNNELHKYEKVVNYENAKKELVNEANYIINTTIGLMIGTELGLHISTYGLNLDATSLKDFSLRTISVVLTYILLRVLNIKKQDLKLIRDNFEFKEYLDYINKKRIINKNEKDIKNTELDKENLLSLKKELEQYIFNVKSIDDNKIKKIDKLTKSLSKKYN